MPLAEHGLRPLLLRRRPGRPQLKRDPLGSTIGNQETTSTDAVAEPYLERLITIVREARPAKRPGVRLECKHFFSGAALYANGTICASLTPVGLAVKLSEQSRAAVLRERRGKPLRYFKSGPIKKQYVVLSRATTADRAGVRAFLRESIRYATRTTSSQRTRRHR